MVNERRRAPRIKVDLVARWEGVLNQEQAHITDLSITGCFLLSGGKVEAKELVRLEIELPGQQPLYFWAEVVEVATEIGFAVRFTAMEDEDKKRLSKFINSQMVQKSN